MQDLPPGTPPATRRSLEQRLALYSAVVVTLGAVLGIVAWFPTFAGKQAELSAFAMLKDNPTGALVVRDLGPADAGRHRYDVSYTLILKNTANGAFDIVWSLDELFVGMPKATEATDTALVVNDPPSIWSTAAPGLIDWRRAIYDLATDDLAGPDGDVANAARIGLRVTAPGGGLTGRYLVGHIGAHSARYIIAAPPEAFVNVTMTYGMDRPATLWQRLSGAAQWVRYNEDLAGETVRLGDAAQPGCAFGIVVANAQIRSACAASPL